MSWALVTKIFGFVTAGVATAAVAAEAAGVDVRNTFSSSSSSSSPGNDNNDVDVIPELAERRNAINQQIRRYLNNEYPDFTARLLQAKEGGAHGVPASSKTAQMLIAYWAGWYLGYYPYLGDIFQPEIFDQITGGTAGRWTYSDFPNGDAFDWRGIEKVSINLGNDFGLRRHHGSWLQDNFNVQCFITQVSDLVTKAASGGELNYESVAQSVNVCKTK